MPLHAFVLHQVLLGIVWNHTVCSPVSCRFYGRQSLTFLRVQTLFLPAPKHCHTVTQPQLQRVERHRLDGLLVNHHANILRNLMLHCRLQPPQSTPRKHVAACSANRCRKASTGSSQPWPNTRFNKIQENNLLNIEETLLLIEQIKILSQQLNELTESNKKNKSININVDEKYITFNIFIFIMCWWSFIVFINIFFNFF